MINSVIDALTCCADDCPHNKKDPQNAHQYQIIFEDQQLQLNMFNVYNFNTINMTTVASIIL